MPAKSKLDILSQIEHFGRDAAEREDADDCLIQHFIRTDAYKRAAEGSKTIIVGRKGAGKSAIFLFLRRNQEQSDNTSRAFVVPDTVSAQKIREFIGHGITEQTSKALVWRYLFLVIIARFVVEIATKEWENEKGWPETIAKVRKFLIDNGESEGLTTVEKIKRLAAKIQPESVTIKLSAIGEVEIGKSQRGSEALHLSGKINQLEEFLSETLCLDQFAKKRLHIYVDQVDEIWTNDESSSQTIIGLLLASHHINTRFNLVKTIVFLRTDIYQVLEFDDKDKLHGAELEIQWNEASLGELLYERILQQNFTN